MLSGPPGAYAPEAMEIMTEPDLAAMRAAMSTHEIELDNEHRLHDMTHIHKKMLFGVDIHVVEEMVAMLLTSEQIAIARRNHQIWLAEYLDRTEADLRMRKFTDLS